MVSREWVCQCLCVCYSRFLFFSMSCPAVQRQVQNGPTSDEIEAQRARRPKPSATQHPGGQNATGGENSGQ
ncbi:ena/VASP-like protein isoform X6 [Lates japonicus]|uniref:Ena/VASP-like protein isoform X6 n=1 Tax=Lates japonicus TaxID=270547 RepID=A0AAD3MTP8_LATJO|nr:ena/VASP-like protein isoform X6 [Lates japonicus]